MDRAPVLALSLAALFLLAGCLAPPATAGERHRFGGALTEAASDDEVRELRAIVDPYGGDLVILESFPLQYAVTGLHLDACEEVRERFLARPYVASASECRAETTSASPDAPTSSNASSRKP